MPINFSELLNPSQLKAVQTHYGPLLLLAGAGSGKTRVITYRIVNMLNNNIPQKSILAVTFTNKAAKEMGKRIRELRGKKVAQLTICTFHAFGVRILREWSKKIGYKKDFTIYDQTDKHSLIRELAMERGLYSDSLDLYSLSELFSGIKHERTVWNESNDIYKPLFNDYKQHMQAYHAFDFDDLIIMPIMLFNEHPEILHKYRNRFHYILIDEFQDTSTKQYEMIRLIAQAHNNICVVGDDDQSIYSWRGANYENLFQFEKDFPDFTEIKLEQNYRSSKTILLAANSVIANNLKRKQKILWSGLKTGEPISLYQAADERAEAQYIARAIRSLAIRKNINYDDIGILVRTNHLTRPLEEALLNSNIPYFVSGGQSFFNRKEIKDLVSYLKVIANPDDNTNLLRIINVPRRGIGKQAVFSLLDLSEKESCSLYSAMSMLLQTKQTALNKKTTKAVKELVASIEHYRKLMLAKKQLALHVRSLVEHIDYFGYLTLQHKKEAVVRRKYLNIESLINSIGEYEDDPDNIDPSLFDYLNRITLSSRDDLKEDESDQKVNLMTVHAAKGLEFDTVFIAACEQDIFPHSRSLSDNSNTDEEERRLFYVALTRAKNKVFITSAASRRKKGELADTVPSPFLEEIPREIIELSKEEEVVKKSEADHFFTQLKKRLS